MNYNNIFLTKDGLENLKEEIKHLEGEKRKEIQEDISRALEYGDITENAEYNIAQEAQRMNEINIVRLKQKLSRATIVDEDYYTEGISIGTTLELKNLDSGEKIKYIFVGSKEKETYPEMDNMGLINLGEKVFQSEKTMIIQIE